MAACPRSVAADQQDADASFHQLTVHLHGRETCKCLFMGVAGVNQGPVFTHAASLQAEPDVNL